MKNLLTSVFISVRGKVRFVLDRLPRIQIKVLPSKHKVRQERVRYEVRETLFELEDCWEPTQSDYFEHLWVEHVDTLRVIPFATITPITEKK